MLLEIYKLSAVADPIRLNRSLNPLVDLGWVRSTHVNSHWRRAGLDSLSLWAANVCSIPHPRAMEEFLRRAKTIPPTFNIDDIIVSWCLSGSRRPFDLLFANHGALMRGARTIICSLAKNENILARFDVERSFNRVWSSFLQDSPFSNLETLVCHVTVDGELPAIDGPRIKHLEIHSARSAQIHIEVDDSAESLGCF